LHLTESFPNRMNVTMFGKTTLLWAAALSGIAALLVTIAVLQYRWTSELGRSAELQLGAKLESLMLAWQLDFYGELSSVCVALQVGPDSGAHDSWTDYMQRYQDWSRKGSDHDSAENIYIDPNLVTDVYIWNTAHSPLPRALRFNVDNGKIEHAAVPADLQVLFQRLQSRSADLSLALRAWQLPDAANDAVEKKTARPVNLRLRSSVMTGWQFDPSIPAMVHPIVHRARSLHDSREGRPVDWIVVVLNLETIRNQILPVVTNRYFGGPGGLEYKVAILGSGKSSALLYSSDTDLNPSRVESFDSRMNIFGPPPETVEGSWWESVRNGQALHGEEWHSFSAPVWFPVIHYAPNETSWTLFLQHREGHQAVALANVRRTNLITGIVVLGLLAVSMVFVVIASQRAQSLASLQMNFVASISHELRTPLAVIYSAGENMTDGFAPDISEYGSIITTQTRQLIELVDQILLFSSVKSGKTNYTLGTVDIENLVQEVRKSTSSLPELSAFTLEIDIEKTLPPAIGDKQALRRCLNNLLGNAVKYSGKSRWIGIFCKTEITPNSQTEVTITVKDRGIGITASELQHIFEPFYRGSSVQAAQIHGTGLGLAVVKHMIEAMGGRISVKSEAGSGSAFTLHLQTANGTGNRTRPHIGW